jgi:hypothetical protein
MLVVTCWLNSTSQIGARLKVEPGNKGIKITSHHRVWNVSYVSNNRQQQDVGVHMMLEHLAQRNIEVSLPANEANPGLKFDHMYGVQVPRDRGFKKIGIVT